MTPLYPTSRLQIFHGRWSLFIRVCPTALGVELTPHLHPLSTFRPPQQWGAQTPAERGGFKAQKPEVPALPVTHTGTRSSGAALLVHTCLPSNHYLLWLGALALQEFKAIPSCSKPPSSLCGPGKVGGPEDVWIGLCRFLLSGTSVLATESR